MGRPSKPCGCCIYYQRTKPKQKKSPPNYGFCVKKDEPEHANSTACEDHFIRKKR